MSVSPAWSDWPADEAPGCIRCSVAPPPDQLALFDVTANATAAVGEVMDGSSVLASRAHPHWPRVETSTCGRPGFWRPRTPAIFGARAGVGPLLAFPDTAILISLHQELDEAGAFTLRALWSDQESPLDALRDLAQLWWWRDVRFRVSPTHLIDARKPMTPERKIARRAAVRELEQDFHDRGGYEPCLLNENVVIEDRPCALHCVPVRSAAAARCQLRYNIERSTGYVSASSRSLMAPNLAPHSCRRRGRLLVRQDSFRISVHPQPAYGRPWPSACHARRFRLSWRHAVRSPQISGLAGSGDVASRLARSGVVVTSISDSRTEGEATSARWTS